MHYVIYTKIVTDLQSSPKVFETAMHVSFPLQCWDVITMLRGYNKVFVWDFSLPEGEKVIGQMHN